MNPCEVYLALSAACPKEPSTPRHNSTVPQLPQRKSAIFCWKKRGLRVFLAKHMASEEGIASDFFLATSEDLPQEAAERIGVDMKKAMEGKSARPAIPARGFQKSFRRPALYPVRPHR